jgi:membrane-associated phospholipid phosphatase
MPAAAPPPRGTQRSWVGPRMHRRWVLMFVLGSAAFAVLAAGLKWSEPLVHLDDAVADTLHAHALESPGVVRVMLAVTRTGTFNWFVGLAVVVVAGMRWAGLARLGLIWLAVLIGGGLWVDGLKNTFDRPRPPYNSVFTTERSYSFPSGHAAASTVAYGMLAYCLALRWRTRRRRLALLFGTGALVLLIGFSRLYLGVHYLSDVLAGYALALAWLSLCIYTIEWARVRFNRPLPDPASTPAAGPSP